MKKLGMIVIVLFVLFFGFIFARNIIAQTAIVGGVKAMTGLGVELGHVDIGMLKTTLSLDELKVFNPAGFSDKVMAEFPEIYVQYDLGDFFKGKAHFEEMRVNLKELVVEKTKQNEVNINSLKALAPKGGGGKPPAIQIDTLNLKIGKVVYKDYTTGNPQVQEFNINMDENFKNITDPQALSSLILLKALSKTTISSLANIDLGGLKTDVSKAGIQQVEGVVQGVKEKATETFMQTKGAVQKFFQPKQ